MDFKTKGIKGKPKIWVLSWNAICFINVIDITTAQWDKLLIDRRSFFICRYIHTSIAYFLYFDSDYQKNNMLIVYFAMAYFPTLPILPVIIDT